MLKRANALKWDRRYLATEYVQSATTSLPALRPTDAGHSLLDQIIITGTNGKDLLAELSFELDLLHLWFLYYLWPPFLRDILSRPDNMVAGLWHGGRFVLDVHYPLSNNILATDLAHKLSHPRRGEVQHSARGHNGHHADHLPLLGTSDLHRRPPERTTLSESRAVAE